MSDVGDGLAWLGFWLMWGLIGLGGGCEGKDDKWYECVIENDAAHCEILKPSSLKDSPEDAE